MQVPVSPAVLDAQMRKLEIIANSEVKIHESHNNYPYLRAFLDHNCMQEQRRDRRQLQHFT